jgi:acyl carrier protein
MQQTEVIEQLKGYISREILDGKDIGLDDSTPLLEWGIINSMEMVRIVSFIQSRFDVDIPNDKILPEYFMNLTALSGLILELS